MTLAIRPLGANVNLNHQRRPSLRRVLRTLTTRSWRGAELERDITQATEELFALREERTGGPSETAIHLPASPEAYYAVLEELAIQTSTSDTPAARHAVRALNEGTSTVSTPSLAGFQTLGDQFALALTSAVVLKRMPEVETIIVNTRAGELPAETGIASATAVAENTVISSSDPTLTAIGWSLSKLIGLRTLSNEAMADMVAADRWLNRILSRDVALLQDLQLLEGSGSGANVKGIRNQTGLTTSSWVAAASGSTPGQDDLVKLAGDIFTANAVPTFMVMHPRTALGIGKLKDSTGAYVLPSIFSAIAPGEDMSLPHRVGTLFGVPVYVTTSVPINETQGGSNAATHILYGDGSHVKILERGSVPIRLGGLDPDLNGLGSGLDRIQYILSQDQNMNADQTVVTAGLRTTLVLDQPTAVSVATGII